LSYIHSNKKTYPYPLSFFAAIMYGMITLALPKGSLEAQTLQLFKEADLEVKRTDRDYNPCITDNRIGKIKILRPQEIPTYVEKGYFDLGISGLDWVHETGSDVVEVAKLSYSKTGEGNVKIVVAVHRDEPIDNVSRIRPGSWGSLSSFFTRSGHPKQRSRISWMSWST
jgi:ATP phosphoribosyltransferase